MRHLASPAKWRPVSALVVAGVALAGGYASAQPLAPTPAPSPAAQVAETTGNRAIITRFADMFYRQRRVKDAFDAYVAPNYVQHSPQIADGRAAAVAALTPMFAQPRLQLRVLGTVVDGDMATVFLHAGMAGTPGGAVVDIFRLRGGKIVEHWDVNQPIPAKVANPHPLF